MQLQSNLNSNQLKDLLLRSGALELLAVEIAHRARLVARARQAMERQTTEVIQPVHSTMGPGAEQRGRVKP